MISQALVWQATSEFGHLAWGCFALSWCCLTGTVLVASINGPIDAWPVVLIEFVLA